MAQLSTTAKKLLMTSGVAGLVTPVIDVYVVAGPVSADPVIGDFTLAAYTGYTPVVPTFSTVYVSQPSGAPSVVTSDAVFNGPTSGAGVSAYGWVLHDSASPKVYAWGNFPSPPLSLLLSTDRLVVEAQILQAGSVVGGVSS